MQFDFQVVLRDCGGGEEGEVRRASRIWCFQNSQSSVFFLNLGEDLFVFGVFFVLHFFLNLSGDVFFG